MTAYRITAGVFVLCSTTAVLAAQVPPLNRQVAPMPGVEVPSSVVGPGQLTTALVGCLYDAAQLPARARRAEAHTGGTDYILADAAVAVRPDSPASDEVASGVVKRAGRVYDIENLPAQRLAALAGKPVEIRGRIDYEAPPTAAGHRDLEDLPELEALSIRAMAGTCPSTPAPRR